MLPATREGRPLGAAARADDPPPPLTEEEKKHRNHLDSFEKDRAETSERELQAVAEKRAREQELERQPRRRDSGLTVPSDRRSKPTYIDTSRRSSLQRGDRSPLDPDAMDIDVPPPTPGRASSISWRTDRDEYRNSDRMADSSRAPRDQNRDREWDRRRNSIGPRTPLSSASNQQNSPALSATTLSENSRQHFGPSFLSSELTQTPMTAIGEYSVAYNRYQDAKRNLRNAEDQRSKYQSHFSNFPIMRDQYDGDVRKTQIELDKAKEQCDIAEAQLQRYLRGLSADGGSHEATARVAAQGAVAAQLASPAFRSTIEGIVRDFISKEQRGSTSTGPADFEKLRNDVKELKNLEKKRHDGYRELNLFARQKIVALETRCGMVQRSHNSLGENVAGFERRLGQLASSVQSLKEDVMRAEELSVAAHSQATGWKNGLFGDLKDAVQSMEKLKVRVDEYRDGMNRTAEDLDSLKHAVTQQREDLARVKNDIAEPKMQLSPPLAAISTHENCATKEEIRGLIAKTESLTTSAPVGNEYARQSDVTRLDESFDDLQNFCNESISDALKQFKNGVLRSDRLEQAHDSLLASFTRLQSDQALLKRQTEDIVPIVNDYSGFANAAQNHIKLVRNELQGLTMATSHLSTRMDEWSSKDFYDRLVQYLGKHNPNWFGSGTQLQNLSTICQTLVHDVQGLINRATLLEARIRSAEDAVGEMRPRQQQNNNAASIPNGHTPPADDPPATAGGSHTDQLVDELKKIRTQLDNHIQAHTKDIDDFGEFVKQASDRIAATERQIRDLMARGVYYGSREEEVGHDQ